MFFTSVPDLMLSSIKCKLPAPVGLSLSIGFSYVPVMMRELTCVKEAQQSRGWKTSSRNPLKKMLSHIPIAVPGMKRSLKRGEEIAVTIECRGFMYDPAHRTYRKELKFERTDIICFTILGLLLALGLFLGIWGVNYAHWSLTSQILRKLLSI